MPERKPSDAKPVTPDVALEVGAGAPDPSKCQAGRRSHGFDFPLCFVKPIPDCQFGMRFAGAYFCRHPKVELIIARTRARK